MDAVQLLAHKFGAPSRDADGLRGGSESKVVLAEQHRHLVRVAQRPLEQRELSERHKYQTLDALRERLQRRRELLILTEAPVESGGRDLALRLLLTEQPRCARHRRVRGRQRHRLHARVRGPAAGHVAPAHR